MHNNDQSFDDTHKEKLGLAGKITRLFLQKKELSILAIIVIAVWGTFSFILTPKQYNPEIVAPAFIITTDFPNADASEIYELITRPMEDKISELTKIDNISSQTFPGGRSMVMVKFLVGSDLENAKVELNQKLQDNIGLKPAGAMDPVVQAIDPDDVPILDIGLSSGILSESTLRKLAFDVSDELKQAKGISKVEIKGGRINNLFVEPRAGELSARNISLFEIMGAITSANGVFSVNPIEGAKRNPLLDVSGNIRNVEDLKNLVLRQEGGAILRLGDIAEITYGPGEITSFVSVAKKNEADVPVVHIALSKLKGTNATTVSSDVIGKLEKFKGTMISQDVKVEVLRDEGKTSSEEISKLTFDLTKSILVVAVLLMLFLGFRNAMTAAVSIPLVLLAVFGVGLLAGQTVNRITLFALILSLGLLVDDAIVVIENVARYFRLYPQENRIKLIVRAVDEVGGALALSTLTMAIAFIPMAFVTGMMGPYMAPIPFFVPAALFASLIFSVSINPYLALIFTPKNDPNIKRKSYEEGFFFRQFKKLEERYTKWLKYFLATAGRRKKIISVVAVIFVFSLILPLTPLVPFRMLPKADKNQVYVYINLPNGTAVGETQADAKSIEELILENSEVQNVESFVGEAPVVDFNGLFRGSSFRLFQNQATLRVNLTESNERNISSEKLAQEFVNVTSPYLSEHPNIKMRIVEDPPGPPVLATFLLKIESRDEKNREQMARDFEAEIENIPGVIDLDLSTPERTLDYTYRIRTDKAELLGVAPTDISTLLHVALSGFAVGQYHEVTPGNSRKPEQEYIILRLPKDDRNTEEDLAKIEIPSRNGTSVPLLEIIEKTDSATDLPILSDDRRQATYLSAEMNNRSIVYAVLDFFPKLLKYKLPDGNGKVVAWNLLGAEYENTQTHEHYFVKIDGEWKLTLEVFRDLGLAMGVAIFLIYFVLAAKSESLFVPLLLMVSIPLGLIGVFPGFAILNALKGTYFNATSMIGVIALAGLSVKNTVIYLEYLEPLKKLGKPMIEALVETGRIRLLPITLTSLTAILGSLTIITDPVWEGLAWALIFGLTASTFLTLVVFPIIYYMVEHKKWDTSMRAKHLD
ncbi:MAG: efflux RND transporter permease subunit [Parcubacteria group bacterium]|jgi:multidrug efflux pump subunit AcrB